MMAGEDGYSSEELSEDEQEQEAAAAAQASFREIVAQARVRQRNRLGAIPKLRVQDEDVIFILSLERDGIDYLDGDGRRYTPERVKDKVDMILKDDEDCEIEERQAWVMRELSDKGYAEADNYRVADDGVYRDEINEWTRIQGERIQAASARRRLARMRVAVKDDREEDYYSEEDDDDEEDEIEKDTNACGNTAIW
ncbi:hypothetical protein CFC21_085609 [Triticum aestivum]|uniref:Uncharacterized protein n=2 Tax=Triticum aestivum TaxID=4565 RepID=A0A3B6NXE8_WHEAT|nr:hypothetical protein CFC21_085609 [Triticum aestivum]